MNKKLYYILIIVCLSSCYSYDSETYQEQQSNSKSNIYKETDHSFFWGFQGRELKSSAELKCGNKKIVKVESKNGFLNYFSRVYTLGIYWPITLEVECERSSILR